MLDVPAIADVAVERPLRGLDPSVEIVTAEVEHVYLLADKLRAGDIAEVRGGGHSAKKSLYRGFRHSILCKTAFVDGEIAAMWGLCVGLRPGVSPLSDVAVPWLLTSSAVERVPVSFLKVAKAELALMRANRRRLESFVAADYSQAVKLLRILGFTVEKPVPVGVGGALFSRFHLGFDN